MFAMTTEVDRAELLDALRRPRSLSELTELIAELGAADQPEQLRSRAVEQLRQLYDAGVVESLGESG